ncbi:hypothetical protein EZS27_018808 [termite gut metagenome]|uniref:TIGR02646 family protein n=1 Tax=termite gut metagenome TaxID=433724 RepID=A0A5J4RI63_9ZZZZ
MKKIDKGVEPQEWEEHRNTPGAIYQSISPLREALLREQGYTCAYCMRRIPCKDANSNEDIRIDHIKCREKYPDLQLDYKNMVICCPGAINNDFHCDKKKGASDISFTPFDSFFIDTLSYLSGSGQIKSTNPSWDKELNNVLNLNNSLLKQNRKQTLEGIIVSLGKREEDWRKRNIEELLGKWKEKNKNGQFEPYCGIIVWFLGKKRKRR